MKKITSILLVTGGMFAANFQKAPLADAAIVKETKEVKEATGKKLKVDTDASTVSWVGTKPTGKHNGTIAIQSGKVKVGGGTITGGSFTLDISKLEVKDLEGKSKEGLEGHLKSADFFDAAKNPTADFEITSVTAIGTDKNVLLEGATHTISGNLTLRGVTKNVTFPAKCTITKKKVTAEADFNIDRTQWGMTYGSDGKINKEVNLKLNLVAEK